MNRIHLTQDRDRWLALVNTVINLLILCIKGGDLSRVTVSFSRRTQLR
jgi:hypothetical protein